MSNRELAPSASECGVVAGGASVKGVLAKMQQMCGSFGRMQDVCVYKVCLCDVRRFRFCIGEHGLDADLGSRVRCILRDLSERPHPVPKQDSLSGMVRLLRPRQASQAIESSHPPISASPLLCEDRSSSR